MRSDILIEGMAELFKILRAHIDARRLRVSAELLDMLAARFERLEDINVLDTARAAAHHTAVLDEEKRGARKLFGDPRRDDPHESRVPIFARDHHNVPVSAFLPHRAHRLRVKRVASLLTVGVVRVEPLRQRFDFIPVVACEKP